MTHESMSRKRTRFEVQWLRAAIDALRTRLRLLTRDPEVSEAQASVSHGVFLHV